MRLTTFQPPELRDENNNIIQNGTYGKHTAFTNPQNSGAFDYINNNLQALNDRQNDIDDSKANANDVYTKTEVDSIASGKLDKSGDTITGNLFFPIADADVATSVTYAGRDLTFQDKAGKRIAIIRCIQSGTKKGVDIYAFGTDNANKGALSVYSNGDETTVAEIPTPAPADNSTKIATTAFVNSACLTKTNAGVTFSISVTANNCNLIKIGNTVYAYIWFKPSQAVSGWAQIGTIPAGYRPRSNMRFSGFSNGNALVCFYTQPYGALHVQSSLTAGAEYFATVAYDVAG